MATIYGKNNVLTFKGFIRFCNYSNLFSLVDHSIIVERGIFYQLKKNLISVSYSVKWAAAINIHIP